MNKYVGFMFGLAMIIFFICIAEIEFKQANQLAVSGNYIVDYKKRSEVSDMLLYAKKISNPEAKKIELNHIAELQKSWVAPAQSLDKAKWYKEHFTTGLNVPSLFFISIILLFGIIHFLSCYFEEKDKLKLKLSPSI